MIRRRRSPQGMPGAGAAPAPPERAEAAAPRGPGVAGQVAILLATLALVTGVAELTGAANLGVSLGIGTIVYTIVLMYLMLER